MKRIKDCCVVNLKRRNRGETIMNYTRKTYGGFAIAVEVFMFGLMWYYLFLMATSDFVPDKFMISISMIIVSLGCVKNLIEFYEQYMKNNIDK